jgi:diguanylate cyclase (GGDEF)-like protein/PAS domain S-box-containing protein
MSGRRSVPVPPYTSRRIIAVGFGLILGLSALILLVGYFRLQDSRVHLMSVVEQHNVKVDLLFSMRNLVRERSLSMYAIYFKRDPFERHDEYLRFTGMVDEFVAHRERLHGMGLDATEQKLLDEAFALIRRSQPLQVGLVNRILMGQSHGIEETILTEDLPLERQILEKFDRLVEYERSQAMHVEGEAMRSSNQTIRIMQLLVPLTLLLVLLIAGYVLRQSRRTENALHQEKERAEVTLHSIADAVITTDAIGHVIYLNPVAEQLTGWSTEEARGLPLARIYRILHETTRKPVNHPAFHGDLDGPSVGLERHFLLIGAHGEEFSVEDSVAPIRDPEGQTTGQVLIFRDVSRSRELARQLSWQANHDALTGLPNRRAFESALDRLLESARQDDKQHGLLYIDLDQFKLVNDTSGHAAGDELLRQLATVLQAEIRHSDMLARLGGDEFGVLLEGCSPEQSRRIADQIREAIERFRYVHGDKVFTVLGSIGLVNILADSPDLPSLLSAADRACYMAKEQGRNRVWVHQPDDVELSRRHGEMQQASRLTRALEENRFLLYGQAMRLLRLDVERPALREVLVRMRDENGRLQEPQTFIPAAERYGMMPAIDRWVVNQACTVLAQRTDSLDEILSINISSQSLSDDLFLEFVVEQFRRRKLDPQRCCFEITETAAITNWNRALKFVTTLKAMGCLFALDDFGSGMSSFAYLQNLPVDLVKIDGRFVRQMVHNPKDRAMVEAIHHVAHAMGIATIAECVEDAQSLEALRQLGTDYAQGFAIEYPSRLIESTPVMTAGS